MTTEYMTYPQENPKKTEWSLSYTKSNPVITLEP